MSRLTLRPRTRTADGRAMAARRAARALLALLLALLAGPPPAWAAPGADEETEAPGGALATEAPRRTYALLYDVRIVPSERAARVAIRLGEGASALRRIRLLVDPRRHRDFSGDGAVRQGDGWVEWAPSGEGATLRYVFQIDHLRDDRSYDARCASTWALFRGDDLVPPARVVALRGAHAAARLRLRMPDGWSAALPYPRRSDGTWQVDQPERRFDRPVGWMVLGRIGVVRERVAGVRVAIAGPVGHGLRRLDLLALLRWTLPELRGLLDRLPDRLLVAGAGDPMWRGGLSGPHSLYVHADRPLISNDATSPLLHELVHSVLRVRPGPDADWIAEGLAELYSLEILARSRTLSRRRVERAFERLAAEGRAAPTLRVPEASGAVTARAVTVLRALDREISRVTDGERSLDDLLPLLAREREPLTTARFAALAARVAGRPLDAFFERHVGS